MFYRSARGQPYCLPTSWSASSTVSSTDSHVASVNKQIPTWPAPQTIPRRFFVLVLITCNALDLLFIEFRLNTVSVNCFELINVRRTVYWDWVFSTTTHGTLLDVTTHKSQCRHLVNPSKVIREPHKLYMVEIHVFLTTPTQSQSYHPDQFPPAASYSGHIYGTIWG